MAILEAAACGLYVVSTNVGGIPEVLPEDPYISLAQPTTKDLYDKLSTAIDQYPTAPQFETHRTNPQRIHDQVQKLYSWNRIALKTKLIYQTSIQQHSTTNKITFLQRLERYASVPNHHHHGNNNNYFNYYFTSLATCFLYTVVHLYCQKMIT